MGELEPLVMEQGWRNADRARLPRPYMVRVPVAHAGLEPQLLSRPWVQGREDGESMKTCGAFMPLSGPFADNRLELSLLVS